MLVLIVYIFPKGRVPLGEFNIHFSDYPTYQSSNYSNYSQGGRPFLLGIPYSSWSNYLNYANYS